MNPSAGIGLYGIGLLCDQGRNINHVKKSLPAFHGSGCVGDLQRVICLILFLYIGQFQQHFHFGLRADRPDGIIYRFNALAFQGGTITEPLIF